MCEEKVAINCFRVFDQGILQKQFKNKIVQVSDLSPEPYTLPLQFIGAKSIGTSSLTNVQVFPIDCKDKYSRVVADCIIALEVCYKDANGVLGHGYATQIVPIDVVLSVPSGGINPIEFKAIVSCIAPSGEYLSATTFSIDLCENIIIECGADVCLCVQSYGYAPMPKIIEFNENKCKNFFEQPINPC